MDHALVDGDGLAPQRRARLAMAAVAATLAGCAHIPPQDRADVRITQYLEAHRELPRGIADAIDDGHVTLGMDREQVVVVLGQPLRRRDYGGTPPVETWSYPGYRLHQDHHRTGGSTLFRVIFIDGRVALVEPL